MILRSEHLGDARSRTERLARVPYVRLSDTFDRPDRCRAPAALVGKITIFARMGVDPENVAPLKTLAAEGCKVAADEPGTLVYDWHYSQEHGTLVVLESYADSSPHLTHMQADGHRELMGNLIALVDSIEFFVLGEPTAEHVEDLKAIRGAQFYSELASK
jgi:quinol monooxygenase YgiN